jgi:glycosyltransferase involved in cell wall biosynthesis
MVVILDRNNKTINDRVAPIRPKLLFVIAEDWYFWSHRLPIARAAQRNGYEVMIATRVRTYGQKIRDEGFQLIPLRLSRESYSPLNEFPAIHQLRQIYRNEEPDLVHQVGLKPILYGSIAALGQRNLRVINAFGGLGYLGASSTIKARYLRLAIWGAYRFLLNRPNHHVLLQNHEDKRLLITRLKVSPEKIAVIRGSGVDLDIFRPAQEPNGTPTVLLAARMLWNKGIEEFVEAAQLLRAKGVTARFAMVGDTDLGSPSAISRQQLLGWQCSGAVEWWGHQLDMPQVFRQANLVCLPSHGGEGVPKVLLEAAASGRAIVATDVPGCREIVRQDINGVLVSPRSPVTLAAAIEELLKDPGRRKRMGSCGREIAVSEFSQEAVVHQTLALYSELLRAI